MRRAPSVVLAVANLGLLVLAAAAITVVGPRVGLATLHPSVWGRALVGVLLVLVVLLVALPLLTFLLAAFDLLGGFRRAGLVAAGIAGAVLLVPLLWVAGGGRRLASREEAGVERAWARTAEPMDVFRARFPDAPTSSGAVALEAAAARVGIEMNRRETKGAHPDEASAKALKAVERELHAYFSRPDSATGLAAPPAALAAWAQAHRGALLDLVKTAREGGPIAYETSWGRDDAPPYSILGIRLASSAATLLAVESVRAGDASTADAALEAAWRIVAAARDRGEMIGPLLACSLDPQTLRVLRWVETPTPEWPLRLAGMAHRRAFLRSLQGEALATLARARSIEHVASGPFVRWMAADEAEALRITVEELAREPPCAPDIGAVESRVEQSLLPWNVMARSTLPASIRGWDTAVRVDLESELTRHVLDARARRARDGAWPATLAGLESQVCPGLSWRYVAEGGGLSLSLDPGPQTGPALRFQVR